MNIPLEKRLKRRQHKEIAELQDLAVEVVYSIEENAVLHGGTAIWRCFQGNRFSQDLDFYLKPRKQFRQELQKTLENFGAMLPKCKQTENAIYSTIEKDNIQVSLEIALREFKNPKASSFEKTDGSFIDVLTPTASQLLLEKLQAFKNRKLIRDIYDTYHLSRFVSSEELNAEFLKKASQFLEELPNPADEQNLKSLILTGAVPSFEQMKQVLKRKFSK